jgi:hypothetical protein
MLYLRLDSNFPREEVLFDFRTWLLLSTFAGRAPYAAEVSFRRQQTAPRVPVQAG